MTASNGLYPRVAGILNLGSSPWTARPKSMIFIDEDAGTLTALV